MAEQITVYALQRQLSRRIAAAELGGHPVLVVRRKRRVAVLISVELGLHFASAATLMHVGVAKLARELSSVLKTVQRERTAVVVTRHRRSVAMLIPAAGPVMDAYWPTGPEQLNRILQELRDAPGPTMEELLDHFRRSTGRES